MIATRRRFVRFAWFVLVLNVGVILWGAVVRATGSGAGCGEHWPLCNGQVIPPAPQIKTLIEYGHRLTSGLALLCVIGLVVLAWRAFPRGHVVRRAAIFSLIFELTEGLIGAGLVLLGHVGTNASIRRGYSLGLHLSNTLLLLAALALTAWCARPERADAMRLKWEQGRRFRFVIAAAAVGILLIGVSGAIAALGDTLFAAGSLAEGMRQDFASGAHPFIRLRILHPIIACVLGVYILVLSGYTLSSGDASAPVKRLGIGLIGITCLQLCLGAVNLLLMAPVPIQILHLLLADLLWITFVLFSTELLTPGVQSFTLPK
jgi:cytochrome c oxidase assembly protein subunit 15